MSIDGDDDSGTETVYCINCGEEISADTNFCPECGSEQDVNALQGEHEDEQPDPKTQDTESDTDSSVVEKYGTYASYIWAGFMFLAAFGAFSEGNTQGIIGGVIALIVGLFFLPIVRQKAGIGSLPGIDVEQTSRRNVLTGVGYFFGSAMLVGAFVPEDETETSSDGGTGSDTSNSGSSDGSLQDEYPNAWYIDERTEIVLQNVKASAGQVSISIEGVAINESGQDYSYVQLEFGVLDSSGAKVADALANTSDLADGQRWRFEAVGTGAEDADSFELEGITAT